MIFKRSFLLKIDIDLLLTDIIIVIRDKAKQIIIYAAIP